MAEAAHRSLGPSFVDATLLVSPVGTDGFGKMLADESRQFGMRTDGFLELTDARTAVCNMVLDGSGGLTGWVADMGIVQSFDSTLVSTQYPDRP